MVCEKYIAYEAILKIGEKHFKDIYVFANIICGYNVVQIYVH